jgi:hypothetical protein
MISLELNTLPWWPKYVPDWERALESLRQQGWGYGYGKCHDTATGGEFYLVHLRRGEKKLSISMPTLEEAVTTISRLAQIES